MVCEAGLPTLTQRHVLGAANAQVACQSFGAGISTRKIDLANAIMGHEGLAIAFTSEVFTQSVADAEAGHSASEPDVQYTPSVDPGEDNVFLPDMGHEATDVSLLVGFIFGVANATMGYTGSQSGFANRSQRVANAQTICQVAAPKMTKNLVGVSPSQGHTATTISLQRVYTQGIANASMGMLTAPPSGVATFSITPVAAIAGHTAIPSKPTFLARTFPHVSETAVIVSPPTMTQIAAGVSANYWGPGIGATSTGSLPVGNSGTGVNNNAVAIRFRAKRSSTVSAAKVDMRTGAGFGSGGLGSFEVRILNDDGTAAHKPVDSQRSLVSARTTTGTGTGLAHNPSSVVPLTNPVLRNGAASGITTITLQAGQHAYVTINGGGGTINGKLAITGVAGSNNRVWVGTNSSGNYNGGAGGRIRNTSGPTTGQAGACLHFRDIDRAYVEGLWLDKANTVGDAIIFDHSTGAGSIWVQNVLITGVHYYTTSQQNHGDLFQLQSSRGNQLFMDKVTGYTWNQGILWNTSTSLIPWQLVDLRRVNLKVYDTNLITTDPGGATPPFGHSCIWFFDNSAHLKYPVKLSEVYVWDLQTATGVDPGGLNRNVRKRLQDLLGLQSSMAALGTYSGDPYTGLYTPGSTLVNAGWTGTIRGGIPAGGDFVDGGTISGSGGSGSTVTHSGNFTGLNYTTPGYGTGSSIVQLNTVEYEGSANHIGAVSDRVSARNGVVTFTWSSGKPTLSRNLLYHLEVRNIHTDPVNNWASLNTLYFAGDTVSQTTPCPDLTQFLADAQGQVHYIPNNRSTTQVYQCSANFQVDTLKTSAITQTGRIYIPDAMTSARWHGGYIHGLMSANAEYTMYRLTGNGGAPFHIENCTRFHIRRLKVDGYVWDPIRIGQGAVNPTVQECWIQDARDDSIEADSITTNNGGTLTVVNTFMDNVHTYIATRAGAGATSFNPYGLSLTNCLLSLANNHRDSRDTEKPAWNTSDYGSGQPWKHEADPGAPLTFTLTNCTLMWRRLPKSPAATHRLIPTGCILGAGSGGNVFVWLGPQTSADNGGLTMVTVNRIGGGTMQVPESITGASGSADHTRILANFTFTDDLTYWTNAVSTWTTDIWNSTLNCLGLASTFVSGQTQPTIPDTDLHTLTRNSSGVWSARSQDTPIFSLHYDDGRNQGQGYHDAPNVLVNTTGPQIKCRQRFITTSAMTVRGIGVRAGRWIGAQPLSIRLTNDVGAVLASAAATAGAFTLITNQTDSRSQHSWTSVAFTAPATILAGVTANIQFETTANAEYRFYALNASAAFPASAKFFQNDGVQQMTDGSTWVSTPVQEDALQFYFTVT